MKLIMLLALTTLASCGVTEGLQKNCGSDIEMGCNLIFGTKDADQDERMDKNDEKNREQDEKIAALSLQNEGLIQSIIDLNQELEIIQDNVEDNSADITSLTALIAGLQTQVNTNIVAIAALDTTTVNSITQIIDPCGNGAGYDEVILKTRNGQYLAYFESGSQRYLTKLEIGSYATTDGTGCHFSLTASGLTW